MKNAPPRLLCKLERTCLCHYGVPCYFRERAVHKEKNRTSTSPLQTSGALVIVIERSKRDVRWGAGTYLSPHHCGTRVCYVSIVALGGGRGWGLGES